MPDSNVPAGAEALRRHLEQLKALRGRDAKAGPPARLAEIKRWQRTRLAATYADLAETARYRDATRFFLDDLYGPKDFSARDQSMLRILPVMTRILPASAVLTAALAIEVDALSEVLDRRLTEALPDAELLNEASYAKAYRASSTVPERERQIELIGAVGRRLERLVEKPMVFRTLTLMRGPARLAGLSDLQEFLERGFVAFRAMGGAEAFLATIGARERAIASRLFSGQRDPFSVT